MYLSITVAINAKEYFAAFLQPRTLISVQIRRKLHSRFRLFIQGTSSVNFELTL